MFCAEFENIYFAETGSGPPLLFLHGNTASAKMFAPLVGLYAADFKVMVIDFLGHGRSSRLPALPTDLWFFEALQAIDFLERRGCGPVNVIGTSGGALVALNLALERPELVHKVIADSFEGENSLEAVVELIIKDRQNSKARPEMVKFWQDMHGDDWAQVVDNDTGAVVRHHALSGRFFHKDLSRLEVPVLLTGSYEDEFFSLVAMEDKYKDMLEKIPQSALHFFATGSHPALLSNREEFYHLACEFFLGFSPAM